MIDSWGISCEITLIWMPLEFTDDQSTLVQVMAWCHQATSHYLSQCWHRSLSPYDITRPQWINCAIHEITKRPILCIHSLWSSDPKSHQRTWSALVQVMTWHWTGDIRHYRPLSALVQVMACCLFGAKPLTSANLLPYCLLNPHKQTIMKW